MKNGGVVDFCLRTVEKNFSGCSREKASYLMLLFELAQTGRRDDRQPAGSIYYLSV